MTDKTRQAKSYTPEFRESAQERASAEDKLQLYPGIQRIGSTVGHRVRKAGFSSRQRTGRKH